MKHGKRIRVSLGTAGLLGLLSLHSNAVPTSAYLMTYSQSSCIANCSFCPQARGSTSRRELLSRVVWPDFPLNVFLEKAIPVIQKGKISRICIQALNYPKFINDVSGIVSSILSRASVPLSVSCPPLTKEEMKRLRDLGVERIGIPIDAATPEIFEETKGSLVDGPYRWDTHLAALRDGLEVFGRGKVATHLIVGLGETEREAVESIQELYDMGVYPSLFAFTPVKGTRLQNMSRPAIDQYRRVQVARHLIMLGFTSANRISYSDRGKILHFGIGEDVLRQCISDGRPFMTSGCPSCNRPYYTESPRGPFYNYPRNLSKEEAEGAINELGM